MSTEEVESELKKLENSRKGLVERVSNSYSANIERTKLRIKSVEEYLEALKADYNEKRNEAVAELDEAKLVLASLEAALQVVYPKPLKEIEPEKSKRRTRRTQK